MIRHTYPLLLDRCYILPDRCYMMVSSYTQFYKLDFHDPLRPKSMNEEYESLQNKDTLDIVSLPPKIRDKGAFIHDDLDKEIYMREPKGYTDDSSLVCELRKPLHGIKQGP